MNREIIITKDGSHSFINKDIDEGYHSRYGAISEAKHVFIKNGIISKFKKKIRVLEVGFGTGLNALLTLIQSNDNKQIDYHTIENNPIIEKEYNQLNYCSILNIENSLLIDMHKSNWNKSKQIVNNFQLTKHLISIEEYKDNIKFDIIYFDAFAPNKQKDIWKTEILTKMYHQLKQNGFLVTYCAQGKLKRNLKKIGFKVETLIGPPGKREMIRANRI